jgi:hypothetical protein
VKKEADNETGEEEEREYRLRGPVEFPQRAAHLTAGVVGIDKPNCIEKS